MCCVLYHPAISCWISLRSNGACLLQAYNAVALQGPSAAMLADFAAYSKTSVVRFVGVREAGVNDDIPPLHERPELVVLGSDTRGALPKEPGLSHTPHMELPVGSVKNHRAPQYWELVQRILVRLLSLLA